MMKRTMLKLKDNLMRKLKVIFILFLLLNYNFSYSQWFTEIVEDKFDGEIRYGICVGSSNDATNKNPILSLRKSKNNIALVLTGVGYLIGSTSIKILFDEENRIYSSINQSKSSNNKGVFLKKFTSNGHNINLIEFLNILTKHEKMYVRVIDNSSKIDLEFNLENARKSFSQVETSFDYLVEVDRQKKEKEIIIKNNRSEAINRERKSRIEALSNVMRIAKKYHLTTKSLATFKTIINDELSYQKLTLSDIDSVFFEPRDKERLNDLMQVNGYLLGKDQKLNDAGIYRITKESPIYKEWVKKNEVKTNEQNLKINILKEQTLRIIEDEVLTNSLVNSLSNKNKFKSIKNFDSILITVEGKGTLIPTFYFKNNGEIVEKIDVFIEISRSLISKLKVNK